MPPERRWLAVSCREGVGSAGTSIVPRRHVMSASHNPITTTEAKHAAHAQLRASSRWEHKASKAAGNCQRVHSQVASTSTAHSLSWLRSHA